MTSLTLCKHPARHWATVSGEAFIKSSSAYTKSCTAAAVVPRNRSSSSRTGDRATAARASNPRETVMVFAGDRRVAEDKTFQKSYFTASNATERRARTILSRIFFHDRQLLLSDNVQIILLRVAIRLGRRYGLIIIIIIL